MIFIIFFVPAVKRQMYKFKDKTLRIIELEVNIIIGLAKQLKFLINSV